MNLRQLAYAFLSLSSLTGDVSAQSAPTAPVSNSNFQVVGVFAGEERAFKDSEGYAMGPTKYVFHFLPRGKAFIDWIATSGKSGRMFGSYSVISQPNELKVSADFVPGM